MLLVAALLLHSYIRGFFYPALCGFLFGYIMQRSRFCFAAGFRDIFLIRNTTMARAILLVLGLTTSAFALIYALTNGAVHLNINPAGLHTVAAGLIFGFGMVIAGNCVSGCLMRMGEGYLMQWITFTGLLAGSAAGAWHLGWWYQFSISRSPAIFLPDYLGWLPSLALQLTLLLLLYLLAWRYERKSGLARLSREKFSLHHAASRFKSIFTARSWPYSAGAAGLALINSLLLYLWGSPWGITGGLTYFSGWLSAQAGFNPERWHYFEGLLYTGDNRIFLDHPFIHLAAAMIGGSFLSSLLHHEFRLRRPRSRKYLLSALAGGILMGYSSRVALGCNIGGFLGGVSSLSLHGWVFGLAILAGTYLGGKFFLRYLL